MKVKTYSGYREYMFLNSNAAFLPNGRRIESITYGEYCDWGVVLAKGKNGLRDEWITWKFFRNDLESTSYGNYFDDKSAAIADYGIRVSELEDDDGLMRQRMEENAEQHKLRVIG